MTGAASKQPEKPSGMHHQDIGGALAAAWNEIKVGAQRRMKENQDKLQELYETEQKPTLVGHIEKVDEQQPDDDPDHPPQQPPDDEPDRPSQQQPDDDPDHPSHEQIDDDPDHPSQEQLDENPDHPQQKVKSIFRVETEQLEQVLQEQHSRDLLDQQVVQQGGTGMSDVNLEAEMEKGVQAEELAGSEPQDLAGSAEQDTPVEKNLQEQRDLAGKGAEIDDYSKPYRTGAQERSSRGSARREKQEKEEQEKARMEEEREAERTRQQEEREHGHQVIESALLAEEEEEAKKRLAAICRIKKNKKKAKTDEEHKRKKRRVDEEEEIEDAGEIDDIDNDPDYNPDMDFEDDESMIIDDAESEILEVEKHAHCLNLSDVGEYQVWIREQLVEVERAVKAGSGVAKTVYKKFIEVLRDGIFKMGTWSPIEAADVDQVLKTVIDPSCTAWRKRMKGVKTGNCRQIWKQGEKKEQILRVAEDREIPDSADEVLEEDTLKGKSPEEQHDIKLTIKRYFTHVRKAHEEASCAAGKLAELVDVLDKDEFCTIARAGTRPLVILEFPQAN